MVASGLESVYIPLRRLRHRSVKDKRHHIQYQQEYFDSNCEFFRQPIPADIEERTRAIVKAADLNDTSRVLDVGTGMGVLIKHFLECAVAESNVTGVDLSECMLGEAKRRYPRAHFWQGDISEFKSEDRLFDAVFFNACFGNIFDQERALAVAANVLNSGGRTVISHPLGNTFVKQLREQDPSLVLTLMPDRNQLIQWCNKLPCALSIYRDEPDLYLAVLVRQPR